MGKNQNNGLIGIRVIATLSIMIFHFELSYRFIDGTQIFGTAYLFVELFFIMSGFFFVAGLIDGKHSHDTFIGTMWDKIIRLWPVYAVGLFSLPIIYSLAWYGGNYFEWLKDGNILSFITELFMLQTTGISDFKYVNGPAWYVSALMITYVVAFFFIKYVNSGKIAFCISIASYLLIWIFESPSMTSNALLFGFIPVTLLRSLAGVMLGIACYYFFRKYKDRICSMNPSKKGILELLCIIVIARLVLFRESDWFNCLILLPFCIIVISMYASNKGFVSKILSDKRWVFFSGISYSFYIMQSFCSNIFTCLVPNVEQPWAFIWCITLNFVVAVAIHYCLEIPVMKYAVRKKYEKRSAD